MEYTKEQKKDIVERVEKAQKLLKELDLSMSANVVLYLTDTRYTPKNDLEKN